MSAVDITLTSVPDVDAWAAELAPALRAVLAPIGEVLREGADSCFEHESDPWGEAWPPNAPATLRDRERRGKAGKILQRDGVLRRSVHAEVDEATYTARAVAGGPAAAYAAAQQYGTEDIPARAYLALRPDGTVDLPAEQLAEVMATVQDALDAFAARMSAARGTP